MKRKTYIKKARAHYSNLYKSGKISKKLYNQFILELRNTVCIVSYSSDYMVLTLEWDWE